MHYKTVLVLLLLLLSASVSGLNSSINNSCSGDEEPLVSINDTNGSHVAEPGYYDKDVCVEGAVEFEIKQGCDQNQIETFALFNRTNSHLSMYSTYKYSVCSNSVSASVENTCSKGKAVLSVESDNNTHAAGPGKLSQQLCLFPEDPENVTLEISGLAGTFYGDGQQISSGQTIRIAEYPYIVAEQSSTVTGIVSYGDFIKFSRPSQDTLSLTQTETGFIVPFTSGNHGDIEDRQELVLNREFLNQLSPNFAFFIPEIPTVKVILEPTTNATGFRSTLRGQVEITAANQGLKNGDLVVDFSHD